VSGNLLKAEISEKPTRQTSAAKDIDDFTFKTAPIKEALILGDSCSHCHETGKRLGPHFSHDLTSMRLHRDLADPELAADLLVQQTGDHQSHDLSFAVTEGPVKVS
jgi:hypothetical protein